MARKEKIFHYIYKTTNLLNGKYYYGMHSTDNLEDGYMGSGKRLRYSVNKHGAKNHKVEILEFLPDRKALAKREMEIINLNEVAKEDCMNLVIGGQGGALRIGMKNSQETIEKIRLSLIGKHLSDERKAKISLSGKGKHSFIMTDKTKMKISEAKKGKSSALKGIARTDETKRKISEGNRNKGYIARKPLSDETKRKISEANKGRIVSDELRKKMSERMKGNVVSNKTKQKLSNNAKLQWERYRKEKNTHS